MSETLKENLSAMMDGELEHNHEEVIDGLLSSPSIKANWARYHLLGDSLRQGLPEKIDLGLANRISESIKSEPTVLAPLKSKSRILKPVAGFAIAATVAAMAILGIQQKQEPLSQDSQAPIAFMPSNTNTNALASTVSTSRLDNAQLEQARANARARLNSYLVNYNEYRTNAGFQGMLPYARTVTYENKR